MHKENGDLYLYYTSVKYLDTPEDNITVPKDDLFEASQAMIISKDGFNFDNFNDKSLIIPAIEDKDLGHYTHTRDPKVWEYKDNYYIILGTKVKKDDNEKYTGKLLYYKSKDAKKWEYINSFELHGLGDMWQCAHTAQNFCHRAFFTQIFDAQIFEFVWSRYCSQLCQRLFLKCLQFFSHILPPKKNKTPAPGKGRKLCFRGTTLICTLLS